ncbi:alpha/beta hydrolase [Modestobacter sp. VKM Ac-2979]|uniref:alpha/beta fold hydrolase n=1 Tax=unclassified Modestobacter TaxID=2643866 RepID=UPI0022ABBA3A|nr:MULTISPECIES: alpha/beta hydrolase [unclassified Modestobacter]MCZ2810107.1 alpha/beta hydrolase [Modestobacter sp. VKM Ac-2979]MCZ2844738.1 alpha/beta hydrolase [Modestobacter sp. VKM Ac-2980]
MATTTSSPTTILIAGHWLGAWAWDEVLEHLTADNWRAIPMTLPGLDEQDPERSSKTLDDQAAAIEQTMAQAGVCEDQPAVLVAHSGANAPVSLVLDRHPELVHRVVWVDSGPVVPGGVFAPDVPEALQELPLPPFDVLGEQASLEGLSPEVLERFRARAVPEPGPVLRQPVELTNDARLSVATTIVCCSIPSAQLLELARAGHPMFAEVANLEQLDVIDLPTGHWPMWSRPRDLANAIHSAASRVS